MSSDGKNKTAIISIHPLESSQLLTYLDELLIDRNIAKNYCQELDIVLDNKPDSALGFKNDTSGFILQNACFKGTDGTDFATLISITKSDNRLSVFEKSCRLFFFSDRSPKNNFF